MHVAPGRLHAPPGPDAHGEPPGKECFREHDEYTQEGPILRPGPRPGPRPLPGDGRGRAGRPIAGTPNNDNLYGTASADNIAGGAGDDLLAGYGGDDQLYGEAGTDSLYGGTGTDLLSGGQGPDVLNGEGGNDRMAGGEDNDYLYAASDSAPDTVQCGGGLQDQAVVGLNDVIDGIPVRTVDVALGVASCEIVTLEGN